MRMRFGSGLIYATALVFAVPVAASAATYTYDLNGSLNSSTGGPSLVADGGSLGTTGYSFGPNQGLTLSNVAGSPITSYSITANFFFTDAATTRGNGYRKIIDFGDLGNDAGLYQLNNTISLYPHATGGSVGFGTESQLTLSRSSIGLVDVSLNGSNLFSYDDSVSQQFVFTNASTLHFFEDDAVTARGEAGTGFVDSIAITTNGTVSPVPLPASAPMFGAALLGLGAIGFRLKRRRIASASTNLR